LWQAWAEAIAAMLDNLKSFMQWAGSISPTVFIDL